MSAQVVVRDFDLRHTLECGQYFRWSREGADYRVRCGHVALSVRQENGGLRFDGATPEFVRRLFALDHDLPAIARSLGGDAWLRQALDRYWGLRVMRQEPWECAAAFITSAASNIPRITRNVEDMARDFGRDGAFPRPDEMGGERRLRALRLGFRARYLAEAARLASRGRLEAIAAMPDDDARDALMALPGVGRKVADCVLLFAYGRLASFPVDTWIRKAMTRLYFGGRRVSDDRIRALAAERFGPHAGYAQQYLFVHARERWDDILLSGPGSPAASRAAP